MRQARNDIIESPQRLTRRDWLLGLLAAILAAAIALGFARWRGLFCDEFLTYNDIRRSIPRMIEKRLAAGHSPLYFLYARWGLLLGQSELALRLPSIAALFFSVLGLTGLAGALGLRRHLPAILAVAVCAPNWFTGGTTARYMMLLILASLATLAAAARYAETWSWPRGLALAAGVGLVLWIHASAQFIAVGLLVFTVWETLGEAPPGRRPWLRALGRAWPVAAGVLASVPLLYLIRNHSPYLKRQWVDLWGLFKNVMEAGFGDYRIWPRFFGLATPPMLIAEALMLAGALALVRSALRAAGRPRVWRLLISLLAGIPAALALSTILVRDFQGPARYVTVLSVPIVLALGVAWSAPVARRWRVLYRAGLVVVLGLQFSATVLSRGDRYREAAQFIVASHTGAEPIMATSQVVNSVALVYYGLQAKKDVWCYYSGYRNRRLIAGKFLPRLQQMPPRGFLILYHGTYDYRGVLEYMQGSGDIFDFRLWEPTPSVTVGAFIREERDRAWLKSLSGPRRPWGPDQEIEK